jgi:hypothetical protein
MTSLVTPTSAFTDEVKKLNKNQKAPYSGVLMSGPDFRYFKAQEKRAMDLDLYILNQENQIPPQESPTWVDILLPAIFGALIYSTIDAAIRYKN